MAVLTLLMILVTDGIGISTISFMILAFFILPILSVILLNKSIKLFDKLLIKRFFPEKKIKDFVYYGVDNSREQRARYSNFLFSDTFKSWKWSNLLIDFNAGNGYYERHIITLVYEDDTEKRKSFTRKQMVKLIDRMEKENTEIYERLQRL
jgi:hypothetical protein